MSFYIGFVMKDLVILASDRKFKFGNNYIKGRKLFSIKKNIYGVCLGWEFFGKAWLEYFKRIPFFFEGLMRFIGFMINWNYILCARKSNKLGAPIEGFTSITIGGFQKEESFLYHLDSKDNFQPVKLHYGSIYNCLTEDNKEAIDKYIKTVTQLLGYLQELDIESRKSFFREQIKKTILYVSSKFPTVSSDADIVFITKNDSQIESLE